MSKNDDGKLYRVRDKNDVPKKKWGKVWAINLPLGEAVALKDDLAGKRKSTTVRTELMEVPNPGDPSDGNPDGSWKPPGELKAVAEVNPHTLPKGHGEPADSAKASPLPKMPPPPLGAASAAAVSAAVEAQQRHDNQKAREAAEKEAQARQDELKALSELNLEIEGDLPQGDVDDLLEGVGDQPAGKDQIPAPESYPLPTATGVVVYYDKDGLPPELEGSCLALVLKEWNDDVVTIRLGLELGDLVTSDDGKVVGIKKLPEGPIMPGVPKSTPERQDRCWTELI